MVLIDDELQPQPHLYQNHNGSIEAGRSQNI